MLSKKKLFLFDIDGTLAVGDALFDGSAQLLNDIRRQGGDYYLITNNSTKSIADYQKKFAAWGLDTPPYQFVTAGFIAILFLKEHFPGKKVFVVGTRSFVSDLKNAGIWVTETPDADSACILVGFDNELTYQKTVYANELLFTKPDIPYFATNPDLSCPAPFGFVPDCGAICKMIQCACGREPVFLGKPSGRMARYCIKHAGFSPEETLVVGDRLYTDIACGITAGVDTCALFTGEVQPEDLKNTQFLPTYSFSTVRELRNAWQKHTHS